MFERFTEPARQVMALANRPAEQLGHDYLCSEHVFPGLIRCDAAVGLRILRYVSVDVARLRVQVEGLHRESPPLPAKQTCPRPGAREVVIQAVREADAQRHQ
jgi:ATP-dependent Clp protease ATP-binding subunit ClpC